MYTGIHLSIIKSFPKHYKGQMVTALYVNSTNESPRLSPTVSLLPYRNGAEVSQETKKPLSDSSANRMLKPQNAMRIRGLVAQHWSLTLASFPWETCACAENDPNKRQPITSTLPTPTFVSEQRLLQ
jgi:hypothetical protein